MNSGDARSQLLLALRRVLRPIVRLLIRVGIGYQEFADVARGAFVETAVRDRIGHEGAPTRDHLSLVTGLSAQQVDYYIDDAQAIPNARPTFANVMTEVLHRWHRDPQYLGPYGIPLELEMDSPPHRCVASLVAQVDPKASPGLILEELLQAKSVAYSGEKHFRVLKRLFVPSQAYSAESIEYFGVTLARMVQTLLHNVSFGETEAKRIERCVFADKGLPENALQSFQKYACERTDHFLAEIDDWFVHHANADSNRSGPRIEAGVHAVLYLEPQSDSRPLLALAQTRRKFNVDS